MEDAKVLYADELHNSGMNCAQAVLCAYCDKFDIDKVTAFKIAEGFGAGMGSMQYVCGALAGAIMLLGLKNSSGTTSNLTKATTYKLTKQLTEEFKQINGSVICSELKGLNTGKPLRTCQECIKNACILIEKFL